MRLTASSVSPVQEPATRAENTATSDIEETKVMLAVDLHTHSLFSACGLHTHLEILERAKALGMKAVAITDHGPALNPRFSNPFYDRLRNPVDGVVLLKGMECNLEGESGAIDLPRKYLPFLDIVLLGIHPNTREGLGKAKYTEMLVAAIRKNPEVDIIAHPNDTTYPVEFAAVAEVAAEHGCAVELNNSKNLLNRVSADLTRELVLAVKERGCRIVVTSDMHAIEELGCDDSVMPFLAEVDFPKERIVSDSAEKSFEFIRERAAFKKNIP
jgi:putative hydrolase